MGKLSIVSKSAKNQDLKPTKKALNKIPTDNSDDVDSLSCLKQKKSENIDDKFKLLKSELHSLFLNSKAEASESLPKNHSPLTQTQNNDNYKKQQNSVTGANSKPSKFSEWLSETIENIEVECLKSNINKKLDCVQSLPSTAKLEYKSKYNMTLLPNYKVERLLYKSFHLQNLGIYVLSSSDESDTEVLKSDKVKNQKKRRSRKSSTRSFSSSFPRRRKKRSLDNDVEIIHSENSLNENWNKKVHMDLDIDSYDWTEPFDTRNSTGCSSDLEIIEDDQSYVSLNKGKQDKADLKGNDITTNPHKENSSDTKRTWECPICFEVSQGQSIVATICGHIFCKACLEKHNSTHGKRCPTCRLDLSDKLPIILFDI